MTHEATPESDPRVSAVQQPARRAYRFRRRHVLLLAVIAMAAGFWVGGDWLSTAELRRDPSGLYIPDESLTFGNAWAERDHAWTLPITNDSNKSVHVAQVQMDCHCMSIKPVSFTLAPRQTQQIHFWLDLSPHRFKITDWPWNFSSTVVARLTDDPWYARWKIVGTVHCPVVINPTSLWFDDVPSDHASAARQFVDVHGVDDALGLSATCDPRFATVDLRRMGGGGRWRLAVRTNKRLQPGPLDFHVDLSAHVPPANVPAGMPATMAISIPVHFEVFRDVRASQASLFLGTGRIGETLVGTLTLSSRRRPFTVTSSKALPQGSIEIGSLRSEQRHSTFDLRVPVARIGPDRRTVVFAVTQPAAKGTPDVYEVRVPVLFDGLEN